MKTRDSLWRLAVLHLGLLAGAVLPDRALAATAALLGWNNLGMHCMDSSYAEFSILPPYNTIEAQLIVNGKLVTAGSGYTVTYESIADPDGSINTTSIGKGTWEEFAPVVYGVSVPYSADHGLAGWNMPGPLNTPQPMVFENNNTPAPGASALVNWFRAEGIPITPYDDAGKKNPYPLMRLVARDAANKVVAQSDIVLPVSDEMDCRVCHGANAQAAAMPTGGWITDPDKDREYRLNILKIHDDREFAKHPDLYAEALAAKGLPVEGLLASTLAGKPMLCAACHASEALGTPSFTSAHGNGTVPPLTTSMHGLHATVQDPELNLTLDHSDNRASCYRCHPGSATKCLRGAMGSAVAADGSMAMQCQSCHGTMSQVGSSQRVGWFMEPNCQSCHTGPANHNNGQIRYQSVFDATGKERVPVDNLFATTPNTPAPGISLYRFSTGHGGLQCSACHGSTHAEFPASHRNDNIRNVQIQGHAGVTLECLACHATMPTSPNGGPHGLHPIGQAWVKDHHDAVSQVGLASCQACHGTDNRGTVLSRVQATRSFQVENYGTQTLYRGATVGCYTCHQGPSSSTMNMDLAPAIADVSGRTSAGVPVALVLPVGNSNAVLRIVSQPANGSVGLSNNVATYFPAKDFTGTETFTFAAYDGAKNSSLATATVTVDANPGGAVAPVLVSGPYSQTVLAGDTATFSVVATGGTLSYQWYKDGWPIPGAVDAVLNLSGVTATDAGRYQVLVIDEVGATVGPDATLTVLTPVAITTQPVSQTVLAGATVQFSVVATGSSPLTYQWSRNGTPLSGATSRTLRLSSVTLASSGDYQVRVTNPAGSVDSDVATLTVQAAPRFTQQPSSQSVVEGSTVTFSATVTGYPTPTLQWYKDSVAIPGATGSSLVLPAVTASDAGGYGVIASNPLGTATSSTATLTVRPTPPTLTGFSPTSGPVGTTVTLTGTGFTGTTAVRFNGVAATRFTVASATQVTAEVPAGATTGKVSLTTAGGTATSANNFTVVPVPTLISFSPASGPVGTRVTISGTGFVGSLTVTFNGIAASSVSVSSSTQLSATVPAGATTGPIRVANAAGTATSASPFVLVPAITSFSPGSGPVGTTVTLTGTGFTGATAVRFNGVAATRFTVVSATQVTAEVPAGATTGKVSLTTAGGTATSGSSFTVVPVPTVTSFSPTAGPVGTKVTLYGTGFLGSVTVTFNGVPASGVSLSSSTQLSATVPATATTGVIRVTTLGGTATSATAFRVTPTITGFTPSSGGVGTAVTVTGTGFTGATAVAFNGKAAAFTVVSATTIVVGVPSGATTGRITVTTPGGTATSGSSFTASATLVAPTLSSLSPTSGPVGSLVTVTGTHLGAATSVTVGGTPATFTVLSATQIRVTMPGGGTVRVTTPGGTGASSSPFTVL